MNLKRFKSEINPLAFIFIGTILLSLAIYNLSNNAKTEVFWCSRDIDLCIIESEGLFDKTKKIETKLSLSDLKQASVKNVIRGGRTPITSHCLIIHTENNQKVKLRCSDLQLNDCRSYRDKINNYINSNDEILFIKNENKEFKASSFYFLVTGGVLLFLALWKFL